MPGVFISYCRPSAQVAEQVAAALSSMGYEVWRDDQLPAHRAYGDVIEENLRAAKAVVVLWSSDACQSQWVRAEADYARQAGVLVQASLDGTIPPLPFNQIQCADLSGWEGDLQASGWRKIEQSVVALAGTIGATPAARNRSSDISICVLPFANMSGDAEQEYFSDGISEDITTDLSKVSALAVTARNTAFMFKGQSIDVSDVARKLDVSHVLEGSVRKAGNRVRITAQLIDGKSGDHIWAERFDRDLTDIFAIQDEISKAIVDALKVKLLPEEKSAIEKRGTSNAEAYNLYLLARQYWISGNYGDANCAERVIRICTGAVEIDPTYALAWALMALAQSEISLSFDRPEVDGLKAANRALEIDPAIAEAHCVKARYLTAQGKHGEAQQAIEIALRLDPESWDVNNQAARQAFLHRRMEEATRYFEKAASLMESDFRSWGMLVTCYRARGDHEAVLHASRMLVEKGENALACDPSNGSALGMIAAALAILGQKERARAWIDRALLIDPNNTRSRYNFACALANEIGEPEAALDILEPVYEKLSPALIDHLEADPDFDVVRNEPRFIAGIARAKAKHKSEAANPAAS